MRATHTHIHETVHVQNTHVQNTHTHTCDPFSSFPHVYSSLPALGSGCQFKVKGVFVCVCAHMLMCVCVYACVCMCVYRGSRACDITGKGKCQGGRDQVKVRTTDEEQYSQKKDSTDAFRLHLLHGLWCTQQKLMYPRCSACGDVHTVVHIR
jgi:hypothetical protein